MFCSTPKEIGILYAPIEEAVNNPALYLSFEEYPLGVFATLDHEPLARTTPFFP